MRVFVKVVDPKKSKDSDTSYLEIYFFSFHPTPLQ